MARVQLVVGDEVVGAGSRARHLVRRLDADHADQPRGRALHRSGRARIGDPGGPGGQGRGRRRDRDDQARARRAARRRDRQRRSDGQAAEASSTSRTPTPAPCAQARRLEARRDGARHQLDQDDAGAADERPVPATATSRRPTTSATSAASRSKLRPPPRRRGTRRQLGRGATPASSLTLPPSPRPAPAAPTQACPNCGGENLADALFCEECGYDFTTGQLPSANPPMADPGADWVAEMWIDPDWFAVQDSAGRLRDERRADGRAAPWDRGARSVAPREPRDHPRDRLLERRRGLAPPRAAHARPRPLVRRGPRLHQRHLRRHARRSAARRHRSSPGERHELADDERIYVGAWTRIVVRRATDDEKGAGPT